MDADRTFDCQLLDKCCGLLVWTGTYCSADTPLADILGSVELELDINLALAKMRDVWMTSLWSPGTGVGHWTRDCVDSVLLCATQVGCEEDASRERV